MSVIAIESNIKKLTNTGLVKQDSFSRYLHEINKIPSLTSEEEIALSKKYLEEGDIKSAQKLVASHLKLVVKIAMSYRNYGLSLADMVSEGNLGLMQAVKKFNPSLGYRLSTYSMWWIKAVIQEYVLKSWSLVKIGTTAGQKKLFFSLNKMKNKISKLYDRDFNGSDYKQIAEELNLSVSEVREMDQRLSGRDISLNKPAFNFSENQSDIIDYISDSGPNHDLVFAQKQDLDIKKSILSKGIDSLPKRDREILIARKMTSEQKTLDELSIKYNISKERVRQIENKAYQNLQSFVVKEAERINLL
jgi:RNA polymerase sigma-32 factor